MSGWDIAFREQARSDFQAAELLAEHKYLSQATMLLQMAWEKLAKAALLRGGEPVQRLTQSHNAARKFGAALRAAGVYGSLPSSLASAFPVLGQALKELERLLPSRSAIAPNSEYPWSDPSGAGGQQAFWPAAHLQAPFWDPGSRLAAALRKDFGAILDNFDRWFPAERP